MTKLETPAAAVYLARPAWWRAPITLALLLGIGPGVACALLSLINGMLGTQTSGQIYELFHSKMESRRVGALTYSEMHRLKTANGLFTDAAAYSPVPLTVESGTWRERVNGSFVTDGYFKVIHSRFVLGQGTSCDARSSAGSCFQAVLSQQLWQQHFASDPGIIGRMVSIDDRDFRVQGVVAPGSARVEIDRDPQFWIPTQVEPDVLGFDWLEPTSDVCWLLPIVRIRPGINSVTATNRIQDLLNKQKVENGDTKDFLLLTPGQAKIARTFRIRGHIVGGFGPGLSTIYWLLLLLWAIGAALFAVFRTSWRITLVDALAASLGGCAVAACISLAVARMMISFLRHFGVTTIDQRAGFDFRFLLMLVPTLVGGSLFAYAGQRMLRRDSSRSRLFGTRNETSTALVDLSIRCWTAVKEHRYIVLSGFFIALVAGFTDNGIYGTDFWHHAAVVRELAAHPLHPQNPILALAAAHEGFSPYGLLAASICWIGFSAVNALIVMGLVNLLLLLVTLRAFVRAAFAAKHTDFYALLFMLVLWGPNPWMLSGFLHLNYLIRGTPYPSTFAIALTFLAWYLVVLVTKGYGVWRLILLIPITTTVFLVHPMTAGSMIIGCLVLTFCRGRQPWLGAFIVGAACCAGFALALAWPYYPFPTLILGGSVRFDATNAPLYSAAAVLSSMLFAAIIGLPLLVLRLKVNHRDFLVSMFSCFILVYLLGDASEKFVFGRVMFFMVFVLQLAAAAWFAENEARVELGPAADGRAWLRNLILIATGAGCLVMLPGLISALPIFQNSYGDYAFLSRATGQYDIVLSDFSTSLKIPALAGKVVSLEPDQVMIFVNHTAAEKDTERFFSDATSEQREQILRRYGVAFVLLNKYKIDNWPSVLRSLTGVASIAYADGDMLLLRVNSA